MLFTTPRVHRPTQVSCPARIRLFLSSLRGRGGEPATCVSQLVSLVPLATRLTPVLITPDVVAQKHPCPRRSPSAVRSPSVARRPPSALRPPSAVVCAQRSLLCVPGSERRAPRVRPVCARVRSVGGRRSGCCPATTTRSPDTDPNTGRSCRRSGRHAAVRLSLTAAAVRDVCHGWQDSQLQLMSGLRMAERAL